MRPITAVKHAQGRMPLKLKGVLARHDIKQTEWSAAVAQFDGRPLGESAATILLNWDQWPKRTPRDSIVQQSSAFLRARGVNDEDIAIAFEPEERGDPYWNAQPRRTRIPAKAEARARNPDIEPVEIEMLTAEARKHFQLFQHPFENDVQGPQDVFLSADQRYIRENMHQAAKHGGFLAVIGESGSGKTTLRRDLIERTRNESITYIQPRVFDKRQLTAGMLCDAIICDVSKEAPKMRLEAKARQVERLLTGSAQAGASHVLIIEEAHDLTVSALKHLKRFWELEYGFKKLLAIILIGQPELKGLLDERQNYEAREVIRRCEVAQLEALNGNLEDYLALKFKRVGKGLDDIFTQDAFDAIRARLTDRRRGPGGEHVITQLYPLVVNGLVTRALNQAAASGAPKIDRAVIETL